jgi:dsDNA-specific endonuclease/ATPase MutS2
MEPAGPGSASAAAERVAQILAAAEESAKQMLEQTEVRVRERIAEADRAAENRIQAAEEEAQEILALAQSQAEKTVSDAAGEALAVVARAQESADSAVKDAVAAAMEERAEIEAHSRDLLFEARRTASDVRTDGLEIVSNLREMGDSLRSNADRVLRDVQRIHAQLVARLEAIEVDPREPADAQERQPGAEGPRTRSSGDDDPTDEGGMLDAPEFIPPA